MPEEESPEDEPDALSDEDESPEDEPDALSDEDGSPEDKPEPPESDAPPSSGDR